MRADLRNRVPSKVGFFDPLGSLAPRRCDPEHIPGMMGRVVVRRCARCLDSIRQNISITKTQRQVHKARRLSSSGLLRRIMLSCLLWGLLHWFPSREVLNRHAHYIHGNGKGRKSKGKPQQPPTSGAGEVDEIEFLRDVRDSLPEAAAIRAQPRLLEAEWTAPPVAWQNLSASGGVSLCPRQSIPFVLRSVGYTAIPTAILLTQQPADVGLSGYPSAFVSFTASVLGPQGEREEVTLRRALGSTVIR